MTYIMCVSKAFNTLIDAPIKAPCDFRAGEDDKRFCAVCRPCHPQLAALVTKSSCVDSLHDSNPLTDVTMRHRQDHQNGYHNQGLQEQQAQHHRCLSQCPTIGC